MKQIKPFLKAMSFLFVFLVVNTIYSQSPCGAGYSFTYGVYSGCTYWFKPAIPGSPTVDHIFWRVGSSGTYKRTCDTASVFSSDTAFWTFCFYGNQDVTLIVVFAAGGSCYVTRTINVSCAGGQLCDPDPGTSSIPDPLVEITYLRPDTCSIQNSTVSGCMYSNAGGGNFYIACGWQWAIRIPPPAYNCEYFRYFVQYSDASAGCNNYNCTQLILDTTVQCIIAQMGQPIYIVATEINCCLPNGYQRAYFWTPNFSSASPIGPPTSTLGVCKPYRSCPPGHSGNCTEDQQTMSSTNGFPVTCFTGGKKMEQRNNNIFGDNAYTEQDVIIYNIQGLEAFHGRWKFGNPSNFNLNWPNGLKPGLYLVKFQNSVRKELTKLYKFN